MKMNEEVYNQMKQLIYEYEIEKISQEKNIAPALEEPPYFTNITIEKELKYNPKYGDQRICECGHPYYRHFDTYEGMLAVGCKYCSCEIFKEKKS